MEIAASLMIGWSRRVVMWAGQKRTGARCYGDAASWFLPRTRDKLYHSLSTARSRVLNSGRPPLGLFLQRPEGQTRRHCLNLDMLHRC